MDQTTTISQAAAAQLPLGRFVLDLAHGELRDADGQLAGLRRQALAVLRVLGEQAGHVVGKDELMRRVWPGVVVGDDSLAQAITEIRRLLGDTAHRRIRTVARRGYMLMPDTAPPEPTSIRVPVTAPATETAPPPVASTTTPIDIPADGTTASVGPGSRLAVVAVALLLAGALVGGLVMWQGRTHAPGPASAEMAGVPLRSLVVLPLENEAGVGTDDWFADALTADLTNELTTWTGLMVIGRGTAMRFKGRAADPRLVARELGVRYVVHGTVRREGERVSLEIAFVDGQSGVGHWAERYQVDRAQLGQQVVDISGRIARILVLELGKSVGQRAARLKPEEVEADDLAMQGNSVMLRALGPDNFAESLRLFEQALAKDPDSVRGLGGVVNVNAMAAIFRWAPEPEAAIRRAEQAQARLDALAPDSFFALDGRATLRYWRADWPGVLHIAQQMIERYPGNATSHHHRCSALLRLGRFDESVPSCERAIRISPRDSREPIWHGLIGMDRFMQGRYAEAAEHARHTVTGLPHLPFFWTLLTAALARDQQADEAARVWADFRARHPDFVVTSVATLFPATQKDFVAGRDLVVATVQPFDARYVSGVR